MKTNLEKVEIYSATYEQAKEFGKNHQNRMINHGHVNQIKKAMEAGDFPYMPPITVNDVTGNIIDGQHRTAAFLQAVKSGILPEDSKIEVKIVSIPQEKEIEAICNANVNSKNWSVDDFIDSYARGNEPQRSNYIKLQQFCDSHTLLHKEYVSKTDNVVKTFKRNYRYAVAMLKGKDGKKLLKNGNLELNDDILSLGNIIHDEVETILEILDIKDGPAVETVAIIWFKYRTELPLTDWKKLLKKNKKYIKDELNKKDGLKFETIITSLLFKYKTNDE